MIPKKLIAVDFDGTLCTNMYPNIGFPISKNIEYLIDQQKHGAKLILWTCRIGDQLQAAVSWCSDRGIHFDAINENIPEVLEEFGTDSRKIFAHEYFDDRAKACEPETADHNIQQMNNRDRLLHTGEYDMLCSMNDNLIKRQDENDENYMCIMDALGVEDMFTRHHHIYHKNCADCIAAWLNETK